MGSATCAATIPIGSTGMPWVILILVPGVLFSMGTSRIALGIEWLVKRIPGNRDEPSAME